MKNSPLFVLRIGTLFVFLLGLHICVQAQNRTFAIGTTTPNANAALQVDAPNGNQGVLIPRLTTAQRLAMNTNLAAADAGLLVYDTTEKAVFVWVGTDWESSAAISWPLEDTITNVPNRSNLLNLTYSGTDTVGIALFRSTNANNTFATLFLESQGGRIVFGSTRSAISPGADFRINNTANNQNAIMASTNGSGRAIQGTNTGTGAAGNFTISNAANPANAVFVQTNGTGPGVSMTLSNAANASPAININHSGTGNAITANRPIQATSFIGDGSLLTNLAANDLTYPFKDSVTTTVTGNDVFALKYNNAASKRVLRVESLSPTNGSSAVSVQHDGTGIGVFSRVNNASSSSAAIWGTTNSNFGGALAPPGVYGEATGTGSVGGAFRINNTANTFPALFAETNGSGPALNARNIGTTDGFAGLFRNTVATNTFPAIQASTAGTGPGVRVIQNATSPGRGMDVFMQNTTGTEVGLSIDQQGLSNAGIFKINNSTNTAPALLGETNGGNLSAGVYGLNTGNGFGVLGRANGTAFGSAAVYGEQLGTGDAAGAFRINNPANTLAGLYGETNGSGSALFANNLGTGRGAQIQINNAANSQAALRSFTNGTGNAGFFTINNAASTAPALLVETNGTGYTIQANRTGGNGDVVYATWNGASGEGSAGNFRNNLASNNASALFASTNAAGGSAIGALNDANGMALSLFTGGLKVSTHTVSAGPDITTRAVAYLLEGSAAGTLTITFPITNGDTFYFFNTTGDAIYINSLANEILPGTGKTMIVLGGTLRSF